MKNNNCLFSAYSRTAKLDMSVGHTSRSLKGGVFRSVWGLAVGLFASTVLLAGCGSGKDSGANIGISVSPEKPAFIDADGSSCVDKAAALSTGDVAERSVSGLRINYTHFVLTWVGTTDLRVDAIKVKIESEAISGGEFTKTLEADEIEALLGFKNAELIRSNLGGNTTFDSARSGKRAADGTEWASCGLVVGGIQLADPKKPTAFTATVTIELRGASIDSNGEESPVRKSVRALAEFDY